MSKINDRALEPSWKRLIGAALLGFLFGGHIFNAFEYARNEMYKGINISDDILLNIDTFVGVIMWSIVIFSAAFVAGIFARKKGILAALIANFVYIISFAAIFIFSSFQYQARSFGIFTPQILLLFFLGSIVLLTLLGGYLGEFFYSPNRDLDINNDRFTVFGIRWFHYFWLGLVIMPTLTSLVVSAYAIVLAILATFYHIVRPSLWLNFIWGDYLMWIPSVAIMSVVVLWYGFLHFWEIMCYKKNEMKWWARVALAIFYGIGAPILSWLLAFWAIEGTYSLPKPHPNDWIISLVVIFIGTSIYIFSKVNEFRKSRNILSTFK